jgi:hypothetical protein
MASWAAGKGRDGGADIGAKGQRRGADDATLRRRFLKTGEAAEKTAAAGLIHDSLQTGHIRSVRI